MRSLARAFDDKDAALKAMQEYSVATFNLLKGASFESEDFNNGTEPGFDYDRNESPEPVLMDHLLRIPNQLFGMPGVEKLGADNVYQHVVRAKFFFDKTLPTSTPNVFRTKTAVDPDPLLHFM